EQEPARELGLVASDHRRECAPRVRLLTPVPGSSSAEEDVRRRTHQVALDLTHPPGDVDVQGGVVLRALAGILEGPVAMEVDESHRVRSARGRRTGLVQQVLAILAKHATLAQEELTRGTAGPVPEGLTIARDLRPSRQRSSPTRRPADHLPGISQGV